MKNKKQIIFIALASLMTVGLVSTAVVVVLVKFSPANTSQTPKTVSTDVSADNLKAQAYEALKQMQIGQAKKLFEQAKVIYQKDNQQNMVAEIDGQLYLIDHTQSQIPTPKPVIIKN